MRPSVVLIAAALAGCDDTSSDPWAGVWIGTAVTTSPITSVHQSGVTVAIQPLADGRYVLRFEGVSALGDWDVAQATGSALETSLGRMTRDGETASWLTTGECTTCVALELTRASAAFDVEANGADGDWLLESDASAALLSDVQTSDDGGATGTMYGIYGTTSPIMVGQWSEPSLRLDGSGGDVAMQWVDLVIDEDDASGEGHLEPFTDGAFDGVASVEILGVRVTTSMDASQE